MDYRVGGPRCFWEGLVRERRARGGPHRSGAGLSLCPTHSAVDEVSSSLLTDPVVSLVSGRPSLLRHLTSGPSSAFDSGGSSAVASLAVMRIRTSSARSGSPRLIPVVDASGLFAKFSNTGREETPHGAGAMLLN